MLRRNFVKATMASIFGIGSVSDSKLSKKPRFLTPTHTIEAKSKRCPREGIRFSCVLESDGALKIGSTMQVKWEAESELEDFIITKIESTKNDHIERIQLYDIFGKRIINDK